MPAAWIHSGYGIGSHFCFAYLYPKRSLSFLHTSISPLCCLIHALKQWVWPELLSCLIAEPWRPHLHPWCPQWPKQPPAPLLHPQAICTDVSWGLLLGQTCSCRAAFASRQPASSLHVPNPLLCTHTHTKPAPGRWPYTSHTRQFMG